MALTEIFRPVKLAIRLALATSWLLTACAAVGQHKPQAEQAYPVSDEWVDPGIVVETVVPGGRGETAGLKKGDVLLSWSDGSAQGELVSPMDYSRVEWNQTISLRTVTIHGSRDGGRHVWELPSADLTLETRPNFSKQLLDPYLEAKESAQQGRGGEAAARWLELGTDGNLPSSLRGWFVYRAAVTLSNAKQWEQADKAYQKAIQELDASGPVATVPWIWKWAWTFRDRGDLESEAQKYNQAWMKINALGAAKTPFAVINLLGSSVNAIQRGDFERAEGYGTQADGIEQQIQPNGIQSLIIVCGITMQRGEVAQAEACDRRALLRANRSHDERSLLLVWWCLGAVAEARGDLNGADEYLKKVQSLAEKLNIFTEDIYGIRGILARDQGAFQTAEQYFQRALAIGLKKSQGSMNVARTYNHLGVLYELQGDLARAEEYLRRALAILTRLGPGTIELAWAHSDLADTLQKRGDLDGAEDHYRQGVAIFYKIARGSRPQAETLGALAGLMRRKRQVDSASSFYDQTLAALENQTSKLGGTADARAGFRARHEKYYREYIDLLLAQNKAGPAFDILERSRARTLLETLAAAHVDVRQGADPELVAKEWRLQADIKAKSERRGGLLSSKHSDEQIKDVEKEISDLTAEYEDVEGLIRSTSPGYAALTQPRPLNATEIRQQLLDPDTLLLEYSLGEERSFVFAVAPDSLQAFELPKRAQIEQAARRVYKLLTAQNRGSADATPAQRHTRFQDDHSLQQALEELSRMVLVPVAPQLGRKRLLIVADGALHYVPFQALPELQDPANPEAQAAAPLVVNHEIINLPSASVLAVLRQQQTNRAPAPKAVAVLADPVFAKDDPRLLHHRGSNASAAATRSLKFGRSHDDLLDSLFSAGVLTRSAAEVGLTRGDRLELPRLRFSRQEANAILAVTPPGLGLKALDFRASRATATSPELSQYRIVHFATHGLLNSEHPELSGLVLSLVDANGKPQEGFLELQDIYNLNLHADLVVLSACETGLGKEISGEGLVGMTRGFMYAGASRVVASLWKVSDAATAQLMAEFYRAMEKDGLAPAAALRHAQIEMWKQKRWNLPYFWAAFQIQGEWK